MMSFGLAEKVLTKLQLWKQTIIQREELARMSDEMLKDIGISKADASREAGRHFWDISPTAHNRS